MCPAFERLGLCRRCADCWQTRMQIVNPSPAAMYSGISNAMVTISRAEGFWSLWKGLSSVVMGAGWFIWPQYCCRAALTAPQAPRMPFTSRHTKPRNTLLVVMRVEMNNTIHLQPVRRVLSKKEKLETIANQEQLPAVPLRQSLATH